MSTPEMRQAAALESIARSMEVIARHFRELGDAATFAGDQIKQSMDEIHTHFISEGGE